MDAPEAARAEPSARPAWQDVSLLDALLRRRSRRFFAGATLDGGPLTYASTLPAHRLTLEEEAALVFAAAGVTGYALAELPYQPGRAPESGAAISWPASSAARSQPATPSTRWRCASPTTTAPGSSTVRKTTRAATFRSSSRPRRTAASSNSTNARGCASPSSALTRRVRFHFRFPLIGGRPTNPGQPISCRSTSSARSTSMCCWPPSAATTARCCWTSATAFSRPGWGASGARRAAGCTTTRPAAASARSG